ncbi:MAG: DUF1559 domain-containing protein [Planctomycetaceae bacterium]|jgi:prepilin-type processing-associated H-X9-DG protein|nr:DUF1559 domain-containing protein [Planctomycetaceae bacterium]
MKYGILTISKNGRQLQKRWVDTFANHSGGVNAGMLDGSVRFISDTIDCNGASSGQVTSGKSPYGVWGALGTPAGGE